MLGRCVPCRRYNFYLQQPTNHRRDSRSSTNIRKFDTNRSRWITDPNVLSRNPGNRLKLPIGSSAGSISTMSSGKPVLYDSMRVLYPSLTWSEPLAPWSVRHCCGIFELTDTFDWRMEMIQQNLFCNYSVSQSMRNTFLVLSPPSIMPDGGPWSICENYGLALCEALCASYASTVVFDPKMKEASRVQPVIRQYFPDPLIHPRSRCCWPPRVI